MNKTVTALPSWSLHPSGGADTEVMDILPAHYFLYLAHFLYLECFNDHVRQSHSRKRKEFCVLFGQNESEKRREKVKEQTKCAELQRGLDAAMT